MLLHTVDLEKGRWSLVVRIRQYLGPNQTHLPSHIT